MRLGEIKSILERCLNDNYKIEVISDPLFGGQAYRVSNYQELVNALKVISLQNWNESDFSPILEIISHHSKKANSVQLSQEEFTKITSYIAEVNRKVPIFYGMLETIVEEQDQYAINIKLPEGKLGTLDKVAKLNEKIGKTLKKFNVDGEFQFVGFDKGTDWIIVVPIGTTAYLTYKFFIACLKIAQEYYKTRDQFFKSKEAEISYKASLKDTEKFSKESYLEYQQKWQEVCINDKINEVIEKIDNTNGETKESLSSKLVLATKDLIKELDEGMEFHLSFNPPEYAQEEAGSLKIDYEKIRLNRETDNAQKHLETTVVDIKNVAEES